VGFFSRSPQLLLPCTIFLPGNVTQASEGRAAVPSSGMAIPATVAATSHEIGQRTEKFAHLSEERLRAIGLLDERARRSIGAPPRQLQSRAMQPGEAARFDELPGGSISLAARRLLSTQLRHSPVRA
jgi:hypothetical protein